MIRQRRFGFVWGIVGAHLFVGAASGQTTGDPDFDACGLLVRGAKCVLFEGGGGRYVLSNYDDDFGVGDLVRVVGTLDENCATICSDGDGCIRGAVLFDPFVFPCGTPIEVAFDPCSGLSAGLLPLLVLVGIWSGRGGGRRLGDRFGG